MFGIDNRVSLLAVGKQLKLGSNKIFDPFGSNSFALMQLDAFIQALLTWSVGFLFRRFLVFLVTVRRIFIVIQIFGETARTVEEGKSAGIQFLFLSQLTTTGSIPPGVLSVLLEK